MNFLILALPLLAGVRPPPVAEWPVHTIEFSPQVTLKDVFDAGLRPWRFPGLENSFLEVKHKVVVFDTVSHRLLPGLQAERFTANVNKPWIITEIDVISPMYDLKEARARMLPWMRYGTKKQAELDAFLQAVSQDWLHYDTLPNGDKLTFAFQWYDAEKKGPRYGIHYMKAWNPDTPLRLELFVNTYHLEKKRDRQQNYDTPVPPPPGYEGADMTAPPNFGPDSPVSWQTDAERGFHPVIMSDGSPLPTKNTPIPTAAPPPPAPAAPAIAANRPVWLFWLCLGAGALFLLIRAVRRRSPQG